MLLVSWLRLLEYVSVWSGYSGAEELDFSVYERHANTRESTTNAWVTYNGEPDMLGSLLSNNKNPSVAPRPKKWMREDRLATEGAWEIADFSRCREFE